MAISQHVTAGLYSLFRTVGRGLFDTASEAVAKLATHASNALSSERVNS